MSERQRRRPRPAGGNTRHPAKAPRREGPAPPRKGEAQETADASSAHGLIWGVNPVEEYLRANPGQVQEVLVRKGRQGGRIQELVELARESGVRVRFTDQLPQAGEGATHQGVMARVAPCTFIALDDLLAEIPQVAAPPLLLAVDCVQDPHNLGALVRTAAATGVHAVILPRDRTAPLGGAAVKASAGTLSRMRVCPVVNLAEALKRVQETGCRVVGAAAEAETGLYRADLTGPLCLVAGGEAKGIRPLVRRQCDMLVSIPMQEGVESLNVSVAAAVVLFEVVRQRLGCGR